MKLDYYNCPKPGDIESIKLPETPEFVKYVPDFGAINKLAEEYQKYENVLIMGHGGSISSNVGIYYALIEFTKKKAYFLSTIDPDYIYELKQKLKPENTLVITITKSGENTTQIEASMQFTEYPWLVITGKSSPFREVGEKLKAKVILHPPIGGRYTGLTEVSLVPAAILGLDAKALYEGAKQLYYLYDKENLAWKAASVFYQLEQKGYADVFMPIYSHNLFPLSNLIVQLCHESFGKNGKGQTYLAAEAPESQHHTNQRFFGGQKNICGFFINSDSVLHPTITSYPHLIHSVQIKGRVLFDINKIPLEKSLEYELKGTLEDARINGIPMAHLSMAGYSPREIGSLIAFWQIFAVYSSVLRDVNPFDQPQVENSKRISFDKRLQYKGLL
ncbi:MAG: hypothetical protein NTX98_00685 [Candidatus Doudnabacteria bacterium]|nr:hypothetical protein [Candidatus Doudnabacteria bacterium]